MKAEAKGIGVFFAVAFGVPVLLGIFMGIAFFGGKSVDAFPLVWMYLPATGAMAGALACKAERTDAEGNRVGLPKVFYMTFCGFTAAMVVLLAAGTFLQDAQTVIWVSWLVYAVSLVGLLELICMKKEKRKAWGLCLFQNTAKSLLGIAIFMLLYLLMTGVSIGVSVLYGASLEDYPLNPYLPNMLLIVLPLNLLLSFTAFFGEEYGWRYYLQPILQQRFGKRRGVLMLGVLWGLWHVPLNLFYYSPSTSLQSILVQIAGCVGMGVFFGWVYMRTQNVWAVTVIHFLNNNMGMVLFNVSPAGVERQWPDTVFTIAIYLLLYLPFLLSVEYRKRQEI